MLGTKLVANALHHVRCVPRAEGSRPTDPDGVALPMRSPFDLPFAAVPIELLHVLPKLMVNERLGFFLAAEGCD